MTAPLSPETLTAQVLDQFGDLLEVGLLTVDADLVIRGWNRWLEVASGRTAEQVIGARLLEVFPQLAGTPAEQGLRTALSGRAVIFSHHFHRYLLPLPPVTGFDVFEHMQQTARIVPMQRADGSVEGAVVAIRDVTDRVARESTLRDAMRRAESASEAKSEFLAAMSHELRTPLAAVIGYVDVLMHQMAGPLTTVQFAHLTRVRACATHLIAIIEEILTFSRTDAGKETIVADELDAADMVRQAVAVLEPQAVDKGLQLDVSLPDHAVMIRSDATKLRQVLINLLGNAVKFTDHGRVWLELSRTEDVVVFRVRDSGPGIATNDLEKIFEPFTQVDQSRTRTKGGTGLGLPVSLKIAHLLGGDLHVESVVGAGSTFTLRLPLTLVPALPDVPADVPPAQATAKAPAQANAEATA